MFAKTAHITAASDFWEIDEALYWFEQPYYRYCASGGGCNPSTDIPGWNEERARLTELWLAKDPFKKPEPEKIGFWKSVLNLFKKST